MSADPLEALLAMPEAPVQEPPPGPPSRVAKVRYTHAAMIDYILSHPAVHQNDLAELFGYTASWVSTIMASDAFQAAFAARSNEIIDPVLRATVEDQFKGIAARSMQILREKLDKPSHQIPDQLALRAFELSTRAAGYGVKERQAPMPPAEMHVHLDSLGERLIHLVRAAKAGTLIEGESTRVAESKG